VEIEPVLVASIAEATVVGCLHKVKGQVSSPLWRKAAARNGRCLKNQRQVPAGTSNFSGLAWLSLKAGGFSTSLFW
jgi:hypothetical protein